MKLMFKILLLAIAATCISCSSNKNVAVKTSATTVVPCSEKGTSDALFYRASGNAMSSSINLAKEKAISAAKTELGKKIMSQVIATAEKYAAEKGLKDKEGFRKTIETITHKSIDKTLAPIVPTCENYKEANSKYTAYISVEIERQKILDKIKEQASSNISDFDEIKFEKIFYE